MQKSREKTYLAEGCCNNNDYDGCAYYYDCAKDDYDGCAYDYDGCAYDYDCAKDDYDGCDNDDYLANGNCKSEKRSV